MSAQPLDMNFFATWLWIYNLQCCSDCRLGGEKFSSISAWPKLSNIGASLSHVLVVEMTLP